MDSGSGVWCLLFLYLFLFLFFFFFFQAEDGIRDGRVTGVQTCALPIWTALAVRGPRDPRDGVVVALQRRGGPLGPRQPAPRARRPGSARALLRGPGSRSAGGDATEDREPSRRGEELGPVRHHLDAAVRRRDRVPDALHARARRGDH